MASVLVKTAIDNGEGEVRPPASESSGPELLILAERERESPGQKHKTQSEGLQWAAAESGPISIVIREPDPSSPRGEARGASTDSRNKEPHWELMGMKESLSQEPTRAEQALSLEAAASKKGLNWDAVGVTEGQSQESPGAEEGSSWERGEGWRQVPAGAEEDLSRQPLKAREGPSQKPAGARESVSWEPTEAGGRLGQELVDTGKDLIWEPVGTMEDPSWDCLIQEAVVIREDVHRALDEEDLRDRQTAATAITGRQEVGVENSPPAAHVNRSGARGTGGLGRDEILQDITQPGQQVGEVVHPEPARAPIATRNTEAAAPGDRGQWEEEAGEGHAQRSAGGGKETREGEAAGREILPQSAQRLKRSCQGSATPPAPGQPECRDGMALENGEQSGAAVQGGSAVSAHPELPPCCSETPIEREIRLSLEREELLRRERGMAPSPGSQQYVEVRTKPILSQPLPKQRDRQLAGAQMQRDILQESQREEDLVQLGKVRGLYDRGMPQELQEKRLLFEQKPEALAPESPFLKRAGRGFPTETLPPKSPETKRGPPPAEANGASLNVLEHSLSSSPPSATLPGTEPSPSPRCAAESIQANPFFKLRSHSPQSLLEQEIREVRERENELRRLRRSLYGSQPQDSSDQDRPDAGHSTEGSSSSSFPERLSFGKLDVTWPPPTLSDSTNGRVSEQEERGVGSLRQRSVLLQRWEAGMVSSYPPQDEQ
ncbi:uncharacterized protein LOC115080516 [Rhinatrema bivittatum]|uniref:uncharacterized protein LOC115080516 n=1 Tax=Rhinatrema bivittatum TaxID=194408 RepID=UPI001127B051|nr:uncharacterized protein LOC115080516 [Rhinatrema bivittatum]